MKVMVVNCKSRLSGRLHISSSKNFGKTAESFMYESALAVDPEAMD